MDGWIDRYLHGGMWEKEEEEAKEMQGIVWPRTLTIRNFSLARFCCDASSRVTDLSFLGSLDADADADSYFLPG